MIIVQKFVCIITGHGQKQQVFIKPYCGSSHLVCSMRGCCLSLLWQPFTVCPVPSLLHLVS